MSLLSDQQLLSGRSLLAGESGIKDVSVLNPATFVGALIQGTDRLMYYSDGTQWIGLAPAHSALFDAGNAGTTYTGGAKFDLGSSQA